MAGDWTVGSQATVPWPHSLVFFLEKGQAIEARWDQMASIDQAIPAWR
jgi:hypothetical protein